MNFNILNLRIACVYALYDMIYSHKITFISKFKIQVCKAGWNFQKGGQIS